MRLRIPAALTALALLLATPALAAEGEIKRTPSGKPDLTGTFDAGTLTPLQRDEKYGENLFLSPEDAAKIEADAARYAADRHQISDPNRKPPPVGGDGTTGGAGNVGGYNRFWVETGTEAFAVDGKFRTSILFDPPNGRIPEMTEAGKARSAERRRLRRPNDGSAWWLDIEGHGPYDGPESLPVSERCIVGFTGATPTFPSLYNNFKRVVQTEDHVMILIEMVHDARIVRLNAEHPSPEERKWLGDSIGWWEGDTLVIDSRNFHPKAVLRGATQESHVTERLTLQPNGDILYGFTIDDPATWDVPWSGEYIWKRSSVDVYEYACHEGNAARRAGATARLWVRAGPRRPLDGTALKRRPRRRAGAGRHAARRVDGARRPRYAATNGRVQSRPKRWRAKAAGTGD